MLQAGPPASWRLACCRGGIPSPSSSAGASAAGERSFPAAAGACGRCAPGEKVIEKWLTDGVMKVLREKFEDFTDDEKCHVLDENSDSVWTRRHTE